MTAGIYAQKKLSLAHTSRLCAYTQRPDTRAYLALLRISGNSQGFGLIGGNVGVLDHDHFDALSLLQLLDGFSSLADDESDLGGRERYRERNKKEK